MAQKPGTPYKELTVDVTSALIIPTATITEANKLRHSTETVIFEMLVYEMGSGHYIATERQHDE